MGDKRWEIRDGSLEIGEYGIEIDPDIILG